MKVLKVYFILDVKFAILVDHTVERCPITNVHQIFIVNVGQLEVFMSRQEII